MTLRSCRGTTTPSMFPNMDESPRQKSMTKKSTDHSGDSGILVMASVKTMKASPVPSTPCTERAHVSATQGTCVGHAHGTRGPVPSTPCMERAHVSATQGTRVGHTGHMRQPRKAHASATHTAHAAPGPPRSAHASATQDTRVGQAHGTRVGHAHGTRGPVPSTPRTERAHASAAHTAHAAWGPPRPARRTHVSAAHTAHASATQGTRVGHAHGTRVGHAHVAPCPPRPARRAHASAVHGTRGPGPQSALHMLRETSSPRLSGPTVLLIAGLCLGSCRPAVVRDPEAASRHSACPPRPPGGPWGFRNKAGEQWGHRQSGRPRGGVRGRPHNAREVHRGDRKGSQPHATWHAARFTKPLEKARPRDRRRRAVARGPRKGPERCWRPPRDTSRRSS